jgi:hypothetical protein
MTEPVHINIDLNKLSDIAHTGVRRAVLFMGLGLNAMHQENFRDYQLNKLPIQDGQTSFPVDFFPSDLPNERVDEFKQEFSLWVTGCGLREMLEHYALFLDSIHHYCLIVQQAKGLLGERRPEKEQREFVRRGIIEKLLSLNDKFEIAPSEPTTIGQLYAARNCLTHALGILRPQDCNDQGAFKLAWAAHETIAVGTETGNVVPVPDLIRSGQRTLEETQIHMRLVQRERSFNVGDKLSFSQQDLWELCFFFNAQAIPTTTSSFIDFLRRHDVPVSATGSAS